VCGALKKRYLNMGFKSGVLATLAGDEFPITPAAAVRVSL
jgi:hypothetical protein